MNLKKFLKPDWRKILITPIFFVLLYLLRISSILPEQLGRMVLIVFFFPLLLTFGSCTIGGAVNLACQLGILGLIANIFYLYFISCFIIWIYDKVKKKEVKQINS